MVSQESTQSSEGGMRSVRTALRLLEVLAENSPCGVGEVARSLGLPKSTAHRGLQTLEASGWASVDPLGRYSLTNHLLALGLLASRESGLHEAVYPEMEWLRDQTGETVHLSVRDRMSIVLILRADGTYPVRSMLPLGTRFPLYATSSGLAILTTLDDAEVAEAIAELEVGSPEAGRLTPDQVWENVRSGRTVGYTKSEWRHGIAGIGAVVKSQVVPHTAALTVSMPVHRLADWELPTLGQLVCTAAQRASDKWRSSS